MTETMLQILLIFWLFCAVLIVMEQKTYRVVIYFGIFSLLTAAAYLFLGAPDVAMAEAGIAAFTTIFFIICIEKHYVGSRSEKNKKRDLKARNKAVLSFLFTLFLFGLFVYFAPEGRTASTFLKDQYLALFMTDVGGENAVTAIYLGYRVYDTLFEALILVIAVVAVTHMSWYNGVTVSDGRHSEIENAKMAVFAMRFISPILLLFGVYLITNGHISAGGGFQGGLAIATFFICRYMTYNIYDISVQKVIKLEELIFISIILVAAFAVFLGVGVFAMLPQTVYLLAMNSLIGLKVACGFFILFYRYIAIEQDAGPAMLEIEN